jgi:hypothetical protein
MSPTYSHKLPINKKLLVYKTVLNPIWAYGVKLWGTASTANTETLEGSAHDNGRTMVRADYANTEGSANPNG